jgi:hypothetical protein
VGLDPEKLSSGPGIHPRESVVALLGLNPTKVSSFAGIQTPKSVVGSVGRNKSQAATLEGCIKGSLLGTSLIAGDEAAIHSSAEPDCNAALARKDIGRFLASYQMPKAGGCLLGLTLSFRKLNRPDLIENKEKLGQWANYCIKN